MQLIATASLALTTILTYGLRRHLIEAIPGNTRSNSVQKIFGGVWQGFDHFTQEMYMFDLGFTEVYFFLQGRYVISGFWKFSLESWAIFPVK